MYDEYKMRCQNLLSLCDDENKIKRLNLIAEMLEIPNCFLNISISSALNVFIDLGYTKEEARQEYLKATEFKANYD